MTLLAETAPSLQLNPILATESTGTRQLVGITRLA
jgi:hypothetical protein